MEHSLGNFQEQSFQLDTPSTVMDNTDFSKWPCVTADLEYCQPGKLSQVLASRVLLGISHRVVMDHHMLTFGV